MKYARYDETKKRNLHWKLLQGIWLTGLIEGEFTLDSLNVDERRDVRREFEIFVMYYQAQWDPKDGRAHTYEEIAQTLHMSTRRVEQIVKRFERLVLFENRKHEILSEERS